jgi:uncharacterized protein YecE (DUF72 family)
MPGTVKVGLCGFTVGADEYAHHFPVVEVQQTFYQPPALTTVRRWRERMPAGFEFTLKAWQLVTHRITSSTYRRLRRPLSAREREEVGGFRDTPIVAEGWATTVECAQVLRASCILFQCPASFRPTDENTAQMRRFFTTLERPLGVRLMWEPRGPWPPALVRALCTELELTHVVDPFVNLALTSEPTYFRLHGTTGNRHVYSDEELQRLLTLVAPPGDTYVMFNNLPRVGDARRFLRLLRGRASKHTPRALDRE